MSVPEEVSEGGEEADPTAGPAQREEISGWRVHLVSGRGCLGAQTCMASAEKSGIVISAVASEEKTAWAMLEDMIAKRNAHP